MPRHKPSATAAPPLSAAQPTFRSGAVARLAQMPVSTLRIWEQRYRAVSPTAAPSGHRLYGAADVQRVMLLRQLTEQGYAIGSIAALDATQLQQVASTHSANSAGPSARPVRRTTVLRLIVVGPALALRLQRPVVVQCQDVPWQVTAVFDSLDEAANAADAADAARAADNADATHAASGAGAGVDLLLWQAPGLHASALPALKAAQDAWGARQVAVTYRFAGAAATSAFVAAGAVAIREPDDDAALGRWMASLQGALQRGVPTSGGDPVPPNRPNTPNASDLPAGTIAPRRFDDATLTALAGRSSAIACECPRHVAELLMQLSNFEAYSADCANRSPADAELHAYLQRVAGLSRGLFEAALERVARQEGLLLA